MKIFLDTANLAEIQEAVQLGVISGITTNPPLILKEGTKDIKKTILKIASLVEGTVIAEVLSTDENGMISEAKEISSWRPNIAVKIPMTFEGLKAVSKLNKLGIKTVVTIIFTESQALLAAQAGATYVAPFMEKSCDICQDGAKLVSNIAEIFSIQRIETQIIVGSIKTPIDVIKAAKSGADIVTVPLLTLKHMAIHPFTDIILTEFLKGWEGVSIK